MKIQNVVKLGASRQIAIPLELWRELKLKPGEYMEVKKRGKGLVLRPKTLVDKVYGPFKTVDEMFDVLDRKKKVL